MLRPLFFLRHHRRRYLGLVQRHRCYLPVYGLLCNFHQVVHLFKRDSSDDDDAEDNSIHRDDIDPRRGEYSDHVSYISPGWKSERRGKEEVNAYRPVRNLQDGEEKQAGENPLQEGG